MLIGKPGPAKTAIATADAQSVRVRGRDLARDLMGRVTFTEYFYLLLTGREPTENQRFFLDLLLVAIAEHGLTPTAVAARMTYDAAPDSLQAAVAAGILGCGPVILGTSQRCASVLAEARERVTTAGEDADAAVVATARAIHERGEPMPGFGHPLHKPVDPRAERILALADDRRVAGVNIDLARRFVPAVHRLGPAAAHERFHAHRRLPARPRLSGGDGPGDSPARPHRRSARPPRRGAEAADRLSHGRTRRGSHRL